MLPPTETMSSGGRRGPPSVPVTVHPLVLSPDVERLRVFYAGLLGAEISQRFPEEGEVFSLELRVDGFRLGLVQVGAVVAGEPGRVLLSIDVEDADALPPRCPFSAAASPAARPTCPGDSASCTCGIPTATPST